MGDLGLPGPEGGSSAPVLGEPLLFSPTAAGRLEEDLKHKEEDQKLRDTVTSDWLPVSISQ